MEKTKVVGEEEVVKKQQNGMDGELKKSKYPTFGQNLCDYFTEFGNYTGIHGIKYMGEQKRSLLEK